MTGATIYAFLAPPAAAFQRPELARIVFFHLPSAFLTTGLVILAAWLGLRFLSTGRPEWDDRLEAALELAALFGIMTLATGILFSKAQWGAWWQWDPRQTSFLLVQLILFAGLVLRAAFSDPEPRRRASAAYAVATVLPLVFLIFVFPRLPHVQQVSFHPTQTVSQNLFDDSYRIGVLWGLAGLGLFAASLYGSRVRVARLERLFEQRHEYDPVDRGPSRRVARPVGVSSAHPEPDPGAGGAARGGADGTLIER